MIDKVCTIGPASSKEEILQGLVEKGMTIIRLNMSHGSQTDHLAVIETVRSISKTTGIAIKILGDLQGPKKLAAHGPVSLRSRLWAQEYGLQGYWRQSAHQWLSSHRKRETRPR